MRVGLLTFHAAYNYGAMLQAFATQKVLEEIGVEVEILDFYPKANERKNLNLNLTFSIKQIIKQFIALFDDDIQYKYTKFKKFRSRMKLTTRYYSLEDLERAELNYDMIIVGSDQVWNIQNGINEMYLLDFVPKHIPKISYASSFGAAIVSDEYSSIFVKHLTTFKAVSVREIDGVNFLQKLLRKKVSHVLDPTLLLTLDHWKRLITRIPIDYDYVFTYGLSKNEKSIEFLRAVSERYNLPVIGIPMGERVPKEFDTEKDIKDAGPDEFLSYLHGATVVVTGSFHGLAFSINFNKTFYVIKHDSRNSRMDSLLKILGLTERQEYTPDDVKNLKGEDLYIDFRGVNCKLSEERIKSQKYLTTALFQ